MRDLLDLIEHHDPQHSIDSCSGAFAFKSPIDGARVYVVASVALGWDHVSVSRKNRCPNWTEMEFIAGLFFEPDETAMQLHIPTSEHISNHPFCLHWWRPLDTLIPKPPSILVGIKEIGELDDAKARAMMRALDL